MGLSSSLKPPAFPPPHELFQTQDTSPMRRCCSRGPSCLLGASTQLARRWLEMGVMPPQPRCPPYDFLSGSPFTDPAIVRQLAAAAANMPVSAIPHAPGGGWLGGRHLQELLEDVANLCAPPSNSHQSNRQLSELCSVVGDSCPSTLVTQDVVAHAVRTILNHLPDMKVTVGAASPRCLPTEFVSADELASLEAKCGLPPLTLLRCARQIFLSPPRHLSRQSGPTLKGEHITPTPAEDGAARCLGMMGYEFKATSPFGVALSRSVEDRRLPCMMTYLLQRDSTSSPPNEELGRHYWLTRSEANLCGTSVKDGAEAVTRYGTSFSSDTPSPQGIHSAPTSNPSEYFHFTDLDDPLVCGAHTTGLPFQAARQVCIPPSASQSKDTRSQLLTTLRSVPNALLETPRGQNDGTEWPLTLPLFPHCRGTSFHDFASSSNPQSLACLEPPILRPLSYQSRRRLLGHWVRSLRWEAQCEPLSDLWGTQEALEATAAFVFATHAKLAPQASESHAGSQPASHYLRPQAVPVALFQGQRLVLLFNACQLTNAEHFRRQLEEVNRLVSTTEPSTQPPSELVTH